MRKEEWPYKPNTIQIELVQGCNRKCRFCGTRGIERGIHLAEPDTVLYACRLIREAGLGSRILLAGHGEPTLHPKLVQIVRSIRETLPKNMIHLCTNGTVIEKKPEMAAELFDVGLNDLIFDEYSDSRVGVFVRADAICGRFPIVEQGSGVPLFADKGTRQRICIVPPIDLDGNTASRKLNNHCGAGQRELREPLKARCAILFRDFFIRWDGNVAICCNDFRGEYFVTNILECKTFHEAYFHERLESARKFSMIKDRKTVHPCDVCSAKPIRPGLLPDARGQMKMEKPTAKDYLIVREGRRPLAKIVWREWEVRND